MPDTIITPPSNGTTAPDFTLGDQNGNGFTLSEFKGKNVLLSFHPLAWTSVCAKQMQSLEASNNTFTSLNTVAVGLSVDSIPCKRAWAESLKIIKTRLLSDFWPHGAVSKLYGVFREQDGVAQRSNIIIDELGKVAYSKVYPQSQLPDIDEIVVELRKMNKV